MSRYLAETSMPASCASEKKSVSHIALARCASNGSSEMTSQQEKKFAKIAEEYKLDTRDVN